MLTCLLFERGTIFILLFFCFEFWDNSCFSELLVSKISSFSSLFSSLCFIWTSKLGLNENWTFAPNVTGVLDLTFSLLPNKRLGSIIFWSSLSSSILTAPLSTESLFSNNWRSFGFGISRTDGNVPTIVLYKPVAEFTLVFSDIVWSFITLGLGWVVWRTKVFWPWRSALIAT